MNSTIICWATNMRPQAWNPSPVCQSGSVRVKGVISACLRCPRWKQACWHIFLVCLSKEACDYEATMSCCQSPLGAEANVTQHRGINWNG